MKGFSMNIVPGPESGAALLRFVGVMDIASVTPIVEAFESLIVNGRCLVVADFEEVVFIGSPIVGALMGARRRLLECGGDLVLASLGADLLDKMNLMGANRVFRFYTDAAAAFRDFKWEHHEQSENMSLELPARAAYVPALRRIVAAVLQQKGYGSRDSYRVETIVDELANNAIEHGDPMGKRFYVDLCLSKKKVEISVRNMHRECDADALDLVRQKIENPVVDDDSIRGRGLALVKMLSNHVEFQIDSSNTLIRVTKLREE